MAVLIFGAGSIGCYLGGLLASAGERVALLGRPYNLDPIREKGLTIQSRNRPLISTSPEQFTFLTSPETMEQYDTIVVTVKGSVTDSVCQEIKQFAHPAAVIVSFQNGLHNAERLQEGLGQTVLAGMVPFNVVQTTPGTFTQTTEGHLYLTYHPRSVALRDRLKQVGMMIELSDEMTRIMWSKLMLNLNNPVNALSGIPLKAMLMQPAYRRCLASLQREALGLLKAAGIKTCRLGKLYPPLLPGILSLPTPWFQRVAKASLAIDDDASSSMQDDLQAGRLTEVDWINGEVVKLALSLGREAPLNARICELIHQAEAQGPEYRNYDGEALWEALRNH